MFVDPDWQGQESGLGTKAVAIIMVKFMTLGVWHEWIVVRRLKSGVQDRTLGIKWANALVSQSDRYTWNSHP